MNTNEESVNEKKRPHKGKVKIKVLVVFANPLNTVSLRLGAEDRAIHEAIKLSPYRANISLIICHAATIHDLRRALLNEVFQIVHISGHGVEEGLVLENELGKQHIIPKQALAKLFEAYSPPIECVILNACHSISQGQLTSLGVPISIAMNGPIDDEAAIEFTRGFYDAIGAGKTIDFAYEEGCRTVLLASPEAQFVSQILKMDDQHNGTENTGTSPIRTNGSIHHNNVNTTLSEKNDEFTTLLDVGDNDYDLEDYENALKAYNKAIKLNAKNAEAYNSKGLALYHLKRFGEAFAAFKEAIRLDASYQYPYLNLGNVLDELNRHDEAIAAYNEAIKLDPDDAIAYSNLALILEKINHYDEAATALKEAIRLEPTNATFYVRFGGSLITLKRDEEAVVAFKEAIKHAPENLYAHINLGCALYNLRRFKEALKVNEEALRLNPTNTNASSNQGAILLALKRFDEAIAAYREAILLDPDNAAVYFGMAKTLQEKQSISKD